jgi:hypothetical protein
MVLWVIGVHDGGLLFHEPGAIVAPSLTLHGIA